MVRRLALLAFFALVLATLVGCAGKTTQAGGLELIIETDVPTPMTFDTVNVKIQQRVAADGTWGPPIIDHPYPIPQEMTLPTTLALAAGKSPFQEVLITVTAIAGSGQNRQPIIQRVITTQVPTDRLLEVRVVLSSNCIRKVTCPNAGDSCQPDLGTCGPGVPPALLPFSPDDLLDAGVRSIDPDATVSTGPDAIVRTDAADTAGDVLVGPDVTVDDGLLDAAGDASVSANRADVEAGPLTPVEAGACQQKDVRCNGQQPQSCASAQWVDSGAPCVNQTCVSGACQGVCGPAQRKCSGGTSVQTCDASGAWGTATACPTATSFCNGAGICGACSDGTTQCAPSGGVQTCSNGVWLTPTACTIGACAMGVCSGTCTPGAASCSGNSVQKCDTTGHLGTPIPCANSACVGGVCQGMCTPGDTRCSAGATQTCDATGAWVPAMTCGSHQSCTGGGSSGAAKCVCVPAPTCSTAGPVCAGAATLATCAVDGQGCLYESGSTVCANGACTGAGGSASCCTNACTNGATKCGGAGVQTCQVQNNGCTAWNAGTPCGMHQTCTGPSGSGACTCNSDSCTSTSATCASSTTAVTCAQDPQGCFYTATSKVCGANRTCTGGNCPCTGGLMDCGGACVACAPGSVCAGQSCACASGSQCTAAVPNGWIGPVAADLGAQSACGTSYPTLVPVGTNPAGAPANCSCTCGTCTGGQCEVWVDEYSSGTDPTCAGAPTSVDVGSSVGTCLGPGVDKSFFYSSRGVASTAGASCGTSSITKNAPAASWGTSSRICTGAATAPGACTNGQTCTPPVSGAEKLCVYRSATAPQACPAGYPVQTVRYSRWNDSRDCTCGCSPSFASCSPDLEFSDNACPGTANSQITTCSNYVGISSLAGITIFGLPLTVMGTTSNSTSGTVSSDTNSTITICCTN